MLPLTPWQLKNQESLVPEESLGDRVFSQGPPSTIAVKLESSARIVVQLVPSRECERLSIRRHRVSPIRSEEHTSELSHRR